nr:hypothetical protein [Chitinophagales bacterium]
MFKLIHNSLSVIIILVTSNLALNAACYTPPAYCTNISANNVGGYGMGIQNVTLNTVALPNQINNTTSAGNGAPIYFDYTSQQLVATSGATVNYSIKGPSGNPSYIRMYIDLNQDGTFGTSAPEMILSFPSVPTSGVGNIVTGTFTLPALGSGSYRIRFASDYQNNIPGPCGPLVYSAEVEDYSLLIPSATADVAATAHTSPGFYLTGNNVVGLQFTNTSNVTITTATIGYQLGA